MMLCGEALLWEKTTAADLTVSLAIAASKLSLEHHFSVTN